MKKYLLIAGLHYYPQPGTEDWVGTFTTKEEAEERIIKTKHKSTNKTSAYTSYKLNNNTIEWYEIIDLSEWVK